MTKGEIIRHYTLSNVITIRSLKYHSLSFVNKQAKPNNPESDAASRLNSQFTGNIGDGGTHFVLFCFSNTTGMQLVKFRMPGTLQDKKI